MKSRGMGAGWLGAALLVPMGPALVAAPYAVTEVHLVEPGGLHDANVSALAWAGHALWVGTFDAGLARFENGRWHSVEVPGGPKERWINALGFDGETLWIGSAAGLARWNPVLGEVESVPEFRGQVQSIRSVGRRLVVAGADRVSVRTADDWVTVDLPGESLHTALLRGDDLWTGGMWGALRRHGEGDSDWRRFSELNGLLPDSWVTALLPVGDEVWVGTYDSGLLALAGDRPARSLRPEAWVNFNALAATPYGVAVGTLEDGLLLWARPDGGGYGKGSWHRLRRGDGLPSDDVTAIVEAEDGLWVGTRGGIARLE